LITLRIGHTGVSPGPITGFRHFWAYYITGFNPRVHCQKCFKGKPSSRITKQSETGLLYEMNEKQSFQYLYICGVGEGPKDLLYKKNFHLALRPSDGAATSAETYNGYTFEVTNAVALPIPELPENWNGLTREMTRCKNFRFGVEHFGYSPES
jgi:hypothetical protein